MSSLQGLTISHVSRLGGDDGIDDGNALGLGDRKEEGGELGKDEGAGEGAEEGD